MERENEQQPRASDGWSEWDAVPRDGPAVFIVDRRAWDEGTVRGRWCNPLAPAHEVRAQIGELLGSEAAEQEWAIVDQVGLGPLMLPELLRADALQDSAVRRT